MLSGHQNMKNKFIHILMKKCILFQKTEDKVTLVNPVLFKCMHWMPQSAAMIPIFEN